MLHAVSLVVKTFSLTTFNLVLGIGRQICFRIGHNYEASRATVKNNRTITVISSVNHRHRIIPCLKMSDK